MAAVADLSFVKSQELKDQVLQWVKWDKNAEDKKELEEIIASKDEEKLQHLFRERIRFGTSGLRGRMAAGPASMNDLTVQQATQGLCSYLEAQSVGGELQKKGVVIGYDARHRSTQFAKITAAVFISRGFRVFLYNRFVATPFVPFGVYHQGAAAGVMVTASHNPKQDNGYKLYWTNGCLIISPHETNITNSIQENLEPWNIDSILTQIDTSGHELLTDPTEEVADSYFKTISSRPYCWFPEQNAKSTTKVTFTPVHGVGQEWVERAFETFKFPSFIHVEEQKKPDPEFSTVTFPNPEEGKGVLSLAMKAAEANGSYVILANDPDSDRCALAERNKETGAWRIFTGDEIGAIFGSWVLSRHIAAGLERERKDHFVVATAVSSRFLKRIATVEGITYHETLTGFKFLGNKARDMIDAGKTFLFAYEESIGYLPGPMSLDKDGVRTAAMMAEMAVQLYEGETPKTFGEYLEDLKKKYGYFETCNRYFFCYDPLVMKAIFDAFRTKNNGSYPTHLGEFKIKFIRDLVVGYDNEREGNKPNLPLSSSSPMITLTFEDFEFEGSIYSGCATFRGSGTEPKLKYYVEASGTTGREETKRVAERMAKTLIGEVLKPEENNLSPPVE